MSTTFIGQGNVKDIVFAGVGHGGSDPGAVANKLEEADLNLQAALAFKDVMVRHGVTVVMSRIIDENDTLAEEIREANASKASLAIDFHTNAGGGDGWEAFHSIFQTQTKGVDKKLATNIETEVKKLGQQSRGLKTRTNSSGRDYFGFIREIAFPSIIIEMAFIDNLKDIKDFDSKAELTSYGLAVAKGTLKTLGIQYKEPSVSTPPTGTMYRVIAGSYTDRSNAEKQQAKLRKDGFNNFLAAYTIKNVHYLRVVVNSYAKRENANSMMAALKQKGYSSFIDVIKL